MTVSARQFAAEEISSQLFYIIVRDRRARVLLLCLGSNRHMKYVVFLTALLGAASAGFAADKTFTGEIMDQQCAQMQSHDNMMKAEGAKDARECTLKCVKDDGEFVLFDPSSKKVYPIKDDKKVRDYAGQRVQVSGAYDDGANVLHVKSIEPAAR